MFCQFPTAQRNDPVTHTCIHSFSHIILPHLKGLDIVPSAIQQDLIAYPFQRQESASINPESQSIPLPPPPSEATCVNVADPVSVIMQLASIKQEIRTLRRPMWLFSENSAQDH